MNNPEVKMSVLCYGDSNTWGVKSDRSGRYGDDERWPGILKSMLSPRYDLIEEGMPGRTTDLDHPNPEKPGRNGYEFFRPFMEKYAPVDVVVVMLGTNDLKTSYGRKANEVAEALIQYVSFARSCHDERGKQRPRIILVSPSVMDDEAPDFESSMPTAGVYDHGSVEKSRQLAAAIEAVARDSNCIFFDAARVAKVGVDGCHMDLQSHRALAESLYGLISHHE